MTKIRNTNVYKFDVSISDNDYVIGSDAETIGKITKNYKIGNLREYINAGLAPEVGGTLKITEVKYEGVLTTPSDVANNLSDTLEVLQYNVVVFNVNGDMYLLNLQNVSIGATEEPIFDYNFTLLSGSKNIGNGAKIIKGIDTDGKKQHRTLKPADDIVKIVENADDIAVSVDETKLSQFVKDNQNNFTFTGENVGTGEGVYKDTTGLVHNFKTLKAENVGTGIGVFDSIENGADEIKFKYKTLTSSDSSVILTENTTTIDLKSIGGASSDNLQKIILTDYTLSDVDDKHTIFIDNGSDKVFITIPLGLKPNFFCVFLQQGTGEVMFTNDVGVTVFTPIGYYIKGQYYWAHLEKVQSQEVYHLLATAQLQE